jgi:hypothetical protein
MAVAILQKLGFEVRYQGQPQTSTAEPLLITTVDGEELLHRELWKIVEEQAAHADRLDRGWFEPSLIAMVFAFNTAEAYLNFIGGRLDPNTWNDERNYFRKEPYRGFIGKLRKVHELTGLPWTPEERPLRTVLELKTLRDLISHGKPETLVGQFTHAASAEIPFPLSTIRSLVTPKGRLTPILEDVEELLDRIHKLARQHVDDTWFGDRALRGPSTYSVRSTTLSR